MQHRDADRGEKIDDLAVFGKAGMERGGVSGQYRREAPELVEQFVDDCAAMRQAERRQQPF